MPPFNFFYKYLNELQRLNINISLIATSVIFPFFCFPLRTQPVRFNTPTLYSIASIIHLKRPHIQKIKKIAMKTYENSLSSAINKSSMPWLNYPELKFLLTPPSPWCTVVLRLSMWDCFSPYLLYIFYSEILSLYFTRYEGSISVKKERGEVFECKVWTQGFLFLFFFSFTVRNPWSQISARLIFLVIERNSRRNRQGYFP